MSIDTSRFLGRQSPQSPDDLAHLLQRMLEIADTLAERLDLLRVAETQASRLPGVRSAEQMLADLHRYLFPERYADVPTYYWHAGTIEDVAALVEAALPDAPRATAAPVS